MLGDFSMFKRDLEGQENMVLLLLWYKVYFVVSLVFNKEFFWEVIDFQIWMLDDNIIYIKMNDNMYRMF